MLKSHTFLVVHEFSEHRLRCSVDLVDRELDPNVFDRSRVRGARMFG
jgi:hypothetical protein